jgi:hypothetical protein
MPGYGSALLSITIILILTALIIFILYTLHTKGIIEIRIPKIFRIYCFKNYLSPEEKAAI